MIHGYASNITIAANLAFPAQHWRAEILEYSTSRSPLRWELTNGSFPIESGGIVCVPTAPGSDVSINEAVVAKFRA